MDTVGDVLAVEHPDDAPALVKGSREYDYRRLRETAFKTGNYLRHCGVGRAATVSVLDVSAPETVFAVLGTGLLGGRVRFAPNGDVDDDVLFGPTAALSGYASAPGCKCVGFGAEPEDPSWAYFEREVWSENPFFPEPPAEPDGVLIEDWSQRDAIEAALEASADLDGTDVVALRGALADPESVILGVLAPLIAGATILLPESGAVGTTVVGADEAPEPAVLRLDP